MFRIGEDVCIPHYVKYYAGCQELEFAYVRCSQVVKFLQRTAILCNAAAMKLLAFPIPL
jgi:hypothetical protein